jgi:hypothetical protein
MTTVRQFVLGSYDLISAHSPTVPLHGSDLSIGIQVLNQLLKSYSATGLHLTISKTVSVVLPAFQGNVVCGPADFLPTPDITEGRLANFEEAWLILEGQNYPLIDLDRAKFLTSWHYEPLKGLPRFVIRYPETEVFRLQVYPAPSQQFEFFLRGKFQKTELTANDTMVSLPGYYELYFQYAVGKYTAMRKGRANAWTPALEAIYRELQDEIEAASEVNLTITGEQASLLNGAWRVRSGV